MKTKAPKVIWKQLTIRVPVEVHRALKVRAAEEGRSQAVIIEGLVRGYLAGTGDLPSAQWTIREKNGNPEVLVWAKDDASPKDIFRGSGVGFAAKELKAFLRGCMEKVGGKKA